MHYLKGMPKENNKSNPKKKKKKKNKKRKKKISFLKTSVLKAVKDRIKKWTNILKRTEPKANKSE